MGINNYSDIQNIETAFGIAFKHPAPVKKLTERITAYSELQAMRPEPREFADMLIAADHSEWLPLVESWAPRLAMADAIQSISHLRIGEQFKNERANIVDKQRWHYLKQIPLADTINDFVTAIEELGEHVNDANAAMLAGKGDAASRAHAAEQRLLTLKEFSGVRGTNHAAFTAMLVEPPTLPRLYRRPAGDAWSIGTDPESRAIEQLHRAAKEVRDRAVFGLRDIASGHHNIPANEHSPGVTFVMSAPANEDDYLQRITDWDALAVYRNRT